MHAYLLTLAIVQKDESSLLKVRRGVCLNDQKN